MGRTEENDKEQPSSHTHSFTRVLGVSYDEKNKKRVIYGCTGCSAEQTR